MVWPRLDAQIRRRPTQDAAGWSFSRSKIRMSGYGWIESSRWDQHETSPRHCLLAIVLSLLRHVRHSYRPHTAVLVEDGGQWRPTSAAPGAVSGPGLVIFQFGADLFYANAGRFAEDVRGPVDGVATPVNWLVVDAGAITGILSASAARVLRDLQQDLIRLGIALVLVHPESSLRANLDRHRLSDVIGADHIFDTLHGALAAIRGQRVDVASATNPVRLPPPAPMSHGYHPQWTLFGREAGSTRAVHSVFRTQAGNNPIRLKVFIFDCRGLHRGSDRGDQLHARLRAALLNRSRWNSGALSSRRTVRDG